MVCTFLLPNHQLLCFPLFRSYAAVMFSQLHAETSRLGARGEAMAARVSALEESMPEAEIRVFTAQDTRQLLPNEGKNTHVITRYSLTGF